MAEGSIQVWPGDNSFLANAVANGRVLLLPLCTSQMSHWCVRTVGSWLTVVKAVVIRDVQQHINGHEVYGDMTLVIAQQ